MKRILATLLAVCMVLSMLVVVPFTATAAVTGADESNLGANEALVGYKAVTPTVAKGTYTDLEGLESLRGFQTNYEISTIAGLKNFAALVNGGTTFEGMTVYLTADLDFSTLLTGAESNDAEKISSTLFAGIGSNSASFMGTFDAQGYTIKDFTLKNETSTTLGFFNSTKNAVVKNLRLVSSSKSDNNHAAPFDINTTPNHGSNAGVGALIGLATGGLTVDNVYANYGINYSYGARAAGLIGMIGTNATTDATAIVNIKNCEQTGNIWLWGRDLNAGLIAQICTGTVTIENCIVSAARVGVGNKDNGGRAIAGLVGSVENTVTSFTMKNCVNKAWVYGSVRVAGLVGSCYTPNNTFIDCTNAGSEVVANGNAGAIYTEYGLTGANYIAGLVGIVNNLNMTNCVNYATVKTATTKSDGSAIIYYGVGGLIGGTQGTSHILTNCVNNGNVSTIGGQRIAGMIGFVASGTNGTLKMTNCTNNGDVTALGTGGRTAGFVGYHDAGNTLLTDCVNTGDVNNAGGDCAGFIGIACRNATLTNCANYGVMNIGNGSGIVGKNAITGLVFNNVKNYGQIILKNPAQAVDGLIAFHNTEACTVIMDEDCANYAKTAQWVGYQLRTNEDETVDLRLVGSIDNINYNSVGFDIAVSYEANGETVTKKLTKSLTTVYTELLAAGENITAPAYRGADARLFALVIEDLPADVELTFTVTTYSLLTYDAERVDGETATFKVTL